MTEVKLTYAETDNQEAVQKVVDQLADLISKEPESLVTSQPEVQKEATVARDYRVYDADQKKAIIAEYVAAAMGERQGIAKKHHVTPQLIHYWRKKIGENHQPVGRARASAKPDPKSLEPDPRLIGYRPVKKPGTGHEYPQATKTATLEAIQAGESVSVLAQRLGIAPRRIYEWVGLVGGMAAVKGTKEKQAVTKRRVHSDEMKADAVAAFVSKKETVKEIAKRLGVHYTLIYDWTANAQGRGRGGKKAKVAVGTSSKAAQVVKPIDPRQNRYPDEVRQKALEAGAAGEGATEIAKKLKVPMQTIYGWLRKARGQGLAGGLARPAQAPIENVGEIVRRETKKQLQAVHGLRDALSEMYGSGVKLNELVWDDEEAAFRVTYSVTEYFSPGKRK